MLHALAVTFRAGWRPAAGWVCTLILLANGVILPLVGKAPADWRAMAVFVGTLLGLAVARSFDKAQGSEDHE